ncbi:MAG TPA: PfaD family polyunsaturated fatty acid/polyketide biosynthesis protein [Anaerolinea sp.]|nr:PfaD family polyunsaturated fatty acid/polyketide biosynthesis protein [Anaerolinea sp.]
MNPTHNAGVQTAGSMAAANPWNQWNWQGPQESIATEEKELQSLLLNLEKALWIVNAGAKVGVAVDGELANAGAGAAILGFVPAVPLESLGDPAFRATYGTRAAYYAGAMAGGIASEDLVIPLGKAGLLGSFGAGGCSPKRVEAAIQKIQADMPEGPYAFNLLNSPNEPATEQRVAEMYVQYNVPVVEASAYLDITYALVHYRVSGLSLGTDGQVSISHRVIAKISRKEVARRFLSPAPTDLVNRLLAEGKITPQQAEWSQQVPMADDITVEADSGGHTDNRPLVCLMPTMLALRDELQEKYQYPVPVRIGAAGGISTPQSALAAFMMGAAYIATGSANQACLEAGTSEHTRKLLAQADVADVAMAPSADMFEMGVKVQVLKRGTMFAPRASKLYEVYTRYQTWEEVPQAERERLENTTFKRKYDDIWADTVKFFTERDPRQLERAANDLHQQMALVFRWYLGLSSRWSNSGEKGREMDYQIWCGPAMGSFNDWTRGTYLEAPENRRVVDVALQILTGTAYLARVRSAQTQGLSLPPRLQSYQITQPLA